MSRDANFEHPLNVFATVDPNGGDIWDVCYHFVQHLYRLKPRRTVLKPEIGALPDGHPFKPKCFSGSSHGCLHGLEIRQKKKLLLIVALNLRGGS